MSRWITPCRGRMERVRHLAGDADRVVTGSCFSQQPTAQRLALDGRHGEPDCPSALARSRARRGYAGVAAGRTAGSLGGTARGPAPPPSRGGALLARPAVVLEVLGQEHGGHPTAAQLALDPVCGGEGRLQALGSWRKGIPGGWFGTLHLDLGADQTKARHPGRFSLSRCGFSVTPAAVPATPPAHARWPS